MIAIRQFLNVWKRVSFREAQIEYLNAVLVLYQLKTYQFSRVVSSVLHLKELLYLAQVDLSPELPQGKEGPLEVVRDEDEGDQHEDYVEQHHSYGNKQQVEEYQPD